MSFVCGLCGEYDEGWGKEITTQPGFPSSVRDSARVCYSCLRALEGDGSDGCGWCGAAPVWDVYTEYDVGPEEVGTLCMDCFETSRGNHPPSFSEDLKNKVRKRDGHECQQCGMPQEAHKQEFGQKLHVHHKDGDKKNNEMDNLVTLCSRCHGAV